MVYVYSALIFFSWLVPLHILPWVGWHQEVSSFALVLVLGWHALILTRDSKNLFIPKAALVVAAGIVIVFFQWFGHQITFGGDALVLGFYLSLIAICFSTGFGMSRQTENSIPTLHGFAMVILAGALTSVVIALVQAFEVWESVSLINRMMTTRRPGSNLGQPNHLATLLLMGVASLCYLYEKKLCGKTLATLCLVLLIFGIAITESRTGLLSFFLMAIWWLARRRSVAFSVTPFAILATCAGLILLAWIWPPFLAFFQGGGEASGLQDEHLSLSAGTRFIVWPQLIEAVLQRPWFGWGLREVSAAHNAVLHAYAQGEPFTYAHNILLDLAVGVGLPLSILLFVVVGIWLWRRLQKTNSLLPWYCIALALPLFVHSLLEFPFAYAYLLIPSMFAVGILEGNLAPNQYIKINWWAAVVALAVVTTTMIWSAFEYIAIEEDFRVARFEALRMGETPKEYERPKIYLLTQMDALLEDVRLVPTPGMSRERIELARKVAMRFPWTATQNRYALSLALNGDPTEAIRQLKVMRAMHGEKMHSDIKNNWEELANTKYPQMKSLIISEGFETSVQTGTSKK